ncbi:MAG: hypothetical protein VW600_12870, partial [Ferrovibrio sp.]
MAKRSPPATRWLLRTRAASLSDVNSVEWGAFAPVVVGCAGPQLTSEERVLFGVRKPLGLILFARNIV